MNDWKDRKRKSNVDDSMGGDMNKIIFGQERRTERSEKGGEGHSEREIGDGR
jgi:hypothetical protein